MQIDFLILSCTIFATTVTVYNFVPFCYVRYRALFCSFVSHATLAVALVFPSRTQCFFEGGSIVGKMAIFPRHFGEPPLSQNCINNYFLWPKFGSVSL